VLKAKKKAWQLAVGDMRGKNQVTEAQLSPFLLEFAGAPTLTTTEEEGAYIE